MDWKAKALKLLNDSLRPIPSELNDIDWKSALSNKTERLAQHISAFANHPGGGVLVYGVNNDGSFSPLTSTAIEETVKRLSNIAHNNLANPIQIEHAVMSFNGSDLLFIYIPEQLEKPVHLRGKDIYSSYYRSGGQTLKMSIKQVQIHISQCIGVSFEDKLAMEHLSKQEVLDLIDYKCLYRLMDKILPMSTDAIMSTLSEYGICIEKSDYWSITNLGAILFSRDLRKFPSLSGREVVVRIYSGPNNRQLKHEQRGQLGYAVGFKGLIDYIIGNASDEKIEITRGRKPHYPQIAIREFVANALIHQDFAIEGTPITIEIYNNRLTITNPGASLNNINRLIDLPPRSRNEKLAQTMLLLHLCERRGSGVDRAIEAVEKMQLPPVRFQNLEDYTRVTLFPQKPLSEMTRRERIDACYQHACLMWEDNLPINNQSIRERFGLNKNQAPTATRILTDTVEAGLIKTSEDDYTSRKYSSYVPYYA